MSLSEFELIDLSDSDSETKANNSPDPVVNEPDTASTNSLVPKLKETEKTQKKIPPDVSKLLTRDTFMENFNPELSNREKRKLSQKFSEKESKAKPGHSHDQNGLIIGTGVDLCDCLDAKCPGCFFQCSTCGSPKCGVECRCNRKYVVESIENEADRTIKTNKFFSQKQS